MRSIRHTREERAAGLPTAAGTGTAVQGREGEETAPPEEQPGPSNVVGVNCLYFSSTTYLLFIYLCIPIFIPCRN